MIASGPGEFTNDMWWLGGSDADVEGDWRWVNSDQSFDSTGFKNWAKGEPDNGNGIIDQDCVTLQRVWESDVEYKWQDQRCEATVSFICEKRIG